MTKFAIVNNERSEPASGLIGICEGCNQLMVAKCGPVKVHHWAHKSKIECDTWWENETEWHRTWKGVFPIPWQEVVLRSDDGVFHRTDVKTDKEWILEFQYSAISSDERASRNAFYRKLAWVVNGLRLKRDPGHFFRSLNVVGMLENHFIRRVCDVALDRSSLLRNWSNDNSTVFFDFNEADVLWCLLPQKSDGRRIVVEFSRSAFIGLHQPSAESTQDKFGDVILFLRSANSASDLIQITHQLRREEERRRQLIADEARRRNPYVNRRASRRF